MRGDNVQRAIRMYKVQKQRSLIKIQAHFKSLLLNDKYERVFIGEYVRYCLRYHTNIVAAVEACPISFRHTYQP